MRPPRPNKRQPLRTKIATRINDIPRADWEKVYPDVLESYGFFKTVDESGIEPFSFCYIMVYDRKKPIGAAPCFLMDYSLDTSINGPLRRITNSIKKINPGIFSIKALVCGTLSGPGRLGIQGVTGERDAVLLAILTRMEQIARKNKALVMAFKDFDGSYAEVLGKLCKKGFVKIDSLPNTQMEIRFETFEQYLMSLSSASRYDLRRKFRKVDGHVKIDFDVKNELKGQELEELYKLYLDIVEKHDMKFEQLPKNFFREIPKNMPGQVRFFTWKIDGKMAAFLFALVSDEMLLDYYIGLDYSIAYKYHLYFIKVRDVINWCLAHKIRTYEMGVTGYEAKRRLGLQFIPLYIYAKVMNRALAPVFKLVCQFLKFENFDPVLREAMKDKNNEKERFNV